MARHPRRKGRIALVLAALPLAVLGGSCVSVLDVGGYGDATGLLCDMLTRCYGEERLPGCSARAADRLDAADTATRAAWLLYFADHHCLESCVNVRRCIDEPPLCGGRGGACDNDWDCCGFVDGSGKCDAAEGTCCLPKGLPCGEGDACCGGEACQAGVCGGRPCKAAGDSCAAGDECCSALCNPQVQQCQLEVCRDNGAECGNNYECCGGYCDLMAGPIGPGGALGRCSDPPCIFEGGGCEGSVPCCTGQNCATFPGLPGPICWGQGCYPDGATCTGPTECCSGYCDPTFGQCQQQQPCLPESFGCTSPFECCSGYCDPAASLCACAPDGFQCNDYFQCCSGNCDVGYCTGVVACGAVGDICSADGACCGGNCGPEGACCDVLSCPHNVCQVGSPLDPACDAGCGTGGFECTAVTASGCIAAVCATLPGCCCTGWDPACVEQAKTSCGIAACPTVVPPG